MDESVLHEIADRYGIDRNIGNADGELSTQALLQVLGALGARTANDAQLEQSLEALDRQVWTRALDSVQVVTEGSPLTVAIRLPKGTATVEWTLQREDGGNVRGATAFAKLTLVAEAMVASHEYECRHLPLEAPPVGYHTLTIQPDGSTMSIIMTPAQCWLPATTKKLWGVSAQLYLLGSKSNWGIGDFADLARLTRIVADEGGDVVGVNPLHAMFPDNPQHASPYSPLSRLLLNVLNISVEAIPEFATSATAQAIFTSPHFQARLARCRASDLVDYGEAAALQQDVLRVLFAAACDGSAERWETFEQFRRERGATFERHCIFIALRMHFAPLDDWRKWPAPYQDVSSEAVSSYANDHHDEVTYVAWLQWVADQQLAAAAQAGAGMRVGLYRDLAVGAHPTGAETWSEPDLLAPGAHIGAPPDPFSASGQDWGLPPVHPHRMRAAGYRSFIELLRANMRHAGALRIDHVMALQRLYWVPEGHSAADGAYVSYPLDDLVGILALESQRQRCVIIGEDLGTVPAGFRERMATANVLSYRVLIFERDAAQNFVPPEQYPELALAVFGNHDLPTLKGWWEGADIALNAQLTNGAAAQVHEDQKRREQDKHALLRILEEQGLIDSEPTMADLLVAVHRLAGRTPALLAMVQLDDIGLECDPVNMPSTQKYPNWRRRLAMSLDDLAEAPDWHRVAAAFRQERSAQ